MYLRIFSFTVFVFGVQLATGQQNISGQYTSCNLWGDSVSCNICLDFLNHSKYTMQYIINNSSFIISGNWRQKGDKVLFKPERTDTSQLYKLTRRMLLTRKGNTLV